MPLAFVSSGRVYPLALSKMFIAGMSRRAKRGVCTSVTRGLAKCRPLASLVVTGGNRAVVDAPLAIDLRAKGFHRASHRVVVLENPRSFAAEHAVFHRATIQL